MSRLARFGRFALVPVGAAGLAAGVVWVLANGLTPGSLALLSLPLVTVLAFGRWRRLGWLVVALDLTWVAARAWRAPAAEVAVCTELACDGHGARWQRVPDEHETARTGAYLSLPPKPLAELNGLFDRAYAELPAAWYGLPNALLAESSDGAVHSLQVARPGPCLVFLHGYGGALTAYVHVLARELPEYAVIAPALDTSGRWDQHLDLVEHVLRDLLPKGVDRSRVYLVGLSNGAVGVSAALERPAIRARVRGFVLVSGAGTLHAHDLAGTRVLEIMGGADDRFSPDYMTLRADELRAAGATLEVLRLEDATHFLYLSHASPWTRRFRTWTSEE